MRGETAAVKSQKPVRGPWSVIRGLWSVSEGAAERVCASVSKRLQVLRGAWARDADEQQPYLFVATVMESIGLARGDMYDVAP
jgi:hypothetical protein